MYRDYRDPQLGFLYGLNWVGQPYNAWIRHRLFLVNASSLFPAVSTESEGIPAKCTPNISYMLLIAKESEIF